MKDTNREKMYPEQRDRNHLLCQKFQESQMKDGSECYWEVLKEALLEAIDITCEWIKCLARHMVVE